jgi:hypothetical protein
LIDREFESSRPRYRQSPGTRRDQRPDRRRRRRCRCLSRDLFDRLPRRASVVSLPDSAAPLDYRPTDRAGPQWRRRRSLRASSPPGPCSRVRRHELTSTWHVAYVGGWRGGGALTGQPRGRFPHLSRRQPFSSRTASSVQHLLFGSCRRPSFLPEISPPVSTSVIGYDGMGSALTLRE